MNNLTGQTIGRYLILDLVGEGGMAHVYKALDTELEREVAIKFLRDDIFGFDNTDIYLKRFVQEARLLAKLTHPNILTILDYGRYERQLYLITSYMIGGSLKKRLGKQYSWEDAFNIVNPIARALEYAHSQNIMHRDVKPGNILFTSGDFPVLADFGLAKILSSGSVSNSPNNNGESRTQLTGENISLGTPDYMAPEQVEGVAEFRSDIYSLGVVFYELVAGRRPFLGETAVEVLLMHLNDPVPSISSFAPNIPLDVERVIMKTLEKNPANRFSNMTEFADALQKNIHVHDDRTRLFDTNVPAYLKAETDEIFQLKSDLTTIGRKNVNRGTFVDIDLTFLDKEKIVSRRHAIIERQGQKYYLRDERSVNGTWLNGRRLLLQINTLLHNDDEICLGKDGVKLFFHQK